MDIASIKPGLVTTRAEMQELFGGGTQEGIIPSTTTPNILIYVDHDSGKKFGYEDGWLLEEEDELGPVFEYTGQGTRGDQTFLGRNGSRNAAVLNHVHAERSLRVFMTIGKVPGSRSGAKRQRYIGEFELDTKQPYTVREALDEEDKPRRIIVFRLRPTGEYERLDRDAIKRAEITDAHRVSVTVAAGKLPEPEPEHPKRVAPKRNRVPESRRAAQPSLIAEHRQAALRDQYVEHLTKQEHDVHAYQIKIAGMSKALTTDLYDSTENELYSVRGESSREEVRIAVGQLKDLARHIKPHPKLLVLLPKRPLDDLLTFLRAEEIDLVFQDGTDFTRCTVK
jgi:hypothetical protein